MASEKAFLKFGCSQEHLEILGHLTIGYPHLQFTIEIILHLLLKQLHPTKVGVVLANLSFSQLVTLMDSLYYHHDPKPVPYSEFARVLSKLDDVSQRRNAIHHSMILATPDELLLYSANKRRRGKGLQTKEISLDTRNLKKLIKDIEAISGTLLLLYFKLEQLSVPGNSTEG